MASLQAIVSPAKVLRHTRRQPLLCQCRRLNLPVSFNRARSVHRAATLLGDHLSIHPGEQLRHPVTYYPRPRRGKPWPRLRSPRSSEGKARSHSDSALVYLRSATVGAFCSRQAPNWCAILLDLLPSRGPAKSSGPHDSRPITVAGPVELAVAFLVLPCLTSR